MAAPCSPCVRMRAHVWVCMRAHFVRASARHGSFLVARGVGVNARGRNAPHSTPLHLASMRCERRSASPCDPACCHPFLSELSLGSCSGNARAVLCLIDEHAAIEQGTQPVRLLPIVAESDDCVATHDFICAALRLPPTEIWLVPTERSCVRLAVESGGPTGVAEDDTGATALLLGAQHGHADVVALLLHHGAALHHCDLSGHTALHWAAGCDRPAVALVLLRARADLQASDCDRLQPIHRAARGGHVRMLRLLHIAAVPGGAAQHAVLDRALAPMARSQRRWIAWAWLRVAERAGGLLALERAGRCLRAVPAVFFLSNVAHNFFALYLPHFVAHAAEHALLNGFGLAMTMLMLLAMGACIRSAHAPPALPIVLPLFSSGDKRNDERGHTEAVAAGHVCHVCRTARAPATRAKHCTTCDRCIARYDHHCPWVGACIGAHNHRAFVAFALGVVGASAAFNLACWKYHAVWRDLHVRASVGGDVAVGVAEELERVRVGTHFLITWIWNQFVHIYFVLLLVAHARQICQNITTDEMAHAARLPHFRLASGEYHNPFDAGLVRNVVAFMGGHQVQPGSKRL